MPSCTLRLRADPGQAPGADLLRAAAILRGGGTVAFATETVYGLGANALDATAVAKIFAAKQRPAWDPLIVHVADSSQLEQVAASVPPAAQAWMSKFWPGPLTLLVPRAPGLPDAVTAGRPLVGVRMPAHPVARAFIAAAQVPVAAPSANTFGHVSPTCAAHVLADLDGRIDALLDSGETEYGLESTVVDSSVDPCVVYRPGAVTLEQLLSEWPSVVQYLDIPGEVRAGSQSLPSPGVGLRHYAPRAQLILVESGSEPLADALRLALQSHAGAALLLPEGIGFDHHQALQAGATAVYPWGQWRDLPSLAHRLFAGLRRLDEPGVSMIVCPVPSPQGLGLAIADRLRKAARQIES